MDPVPALRALAHEHRLGAFRSLVRAGRGGRSVGELREELGLAPATLSAHLNILRAAGWITDERKGRMIRVRADLDRMFELIAYLTENCCEGTPCAPGEEADRERGAQPAPAAHPGGGLAKETTDD